MRFQNDSVRVVLGDPAAYVRGAKPQIGEVSVNGVDHGLGQMDAQLLDGNALQVIDRHASAGDEGGALVEIRKEGPAALTSVSACSLCNLQR